MITSVTIDRLRGVKHGHVAGLTGLSILVGPNGCGKSTVLDALLIAGGPSPSLGLQNALDRRSGVPDPLMWLSWHGGEEGPIAISVDGIASFAQTTIEILDSAVTIRTLDAEGKEIHASSHRLKAGALEVTKNVRRAPMGSLIDSQGPNESLTVLYSDAVRAGRAGLVKEVLLGLVPGFQDLEILSEKNDKPLLYMHWGDRPVPVALAGEGIVALVRTVLQLAACVSDGTALMEEPELHQHPRSLRYMAQGICESAKRGVQIVLTTHSSELMDALLYFADQADMLETISVHLVRLRGGELTATHHDGETARLRIQEIGEDLR